MGGALAVVQVEEITAHAKAGWFGSLCGCPVGDYCLNAENVPVIFVVPTCSSKVPSMELPTIFPS